MGIISTIKTLGGCVFQAPRLLRRRVFLWRFFAMPDRAVAFVDGFNLYHSIATSRFKKYRWLDLKSLVNHFLRKNERLDALNYYTAFATWRSQESIDRHRAYVSALESTGVNVITGKFLRKERSCPLCEQKFQAHEEKFTDVNIALGILSTCIQNEADSIYLVWGDNDLIPALLAARKLYPTVKLNVLLPLNARAKHLKTMCAQNGFRYSKITEEHLAEAQLSDQIHLPKIILSRPSRWT